MRYPQPSSPCFQKKPWYARSRASGRFPREGEVGEGDRKFYLRAPFLKGEPRSSRPRGFLYRLIDKISSICATVALRLSGAVVRYTVGRCHVVNQ